MPVSEIRLEAALARAEQAEAKYRTLVEQVPVITYTEALDNGRCLSVSSQVARLLGYTQEEWMGRPRLWVDLLHPDDRERVIEACELANRDRQTFGAEYRMVARDGRIVWIRDEAVLVRGTYGQPLCWQGVMLDITEDRSEPEDLEA